MILPDINLLMYAYNPGCAQHRPAKKWLEELLNGGQPVGFPWVVILGFIRLTTARGVLNPPVPVPEAMHRVRSWLAVPDVCILQPGHRHPDLLAQTLSATAGGTLTTDAHLAALAIEHNAELHSNDRDFKRFHGLRWHNPLD